MAEDVMEKDEPSDPCCLKWKEKYTKLKERYSKLEEGRNALRKGLSILEPQIAKMQAENVVLKKALEDQRMRGNSEKEDRAKESDMRVALENEVSALKSEILSLQQNGGLVAPGVDQEIANLCSRISEGETEINRLKELSEKERKRADVEKKKAEAERKKADEAAKKVKAENSRATEEKRLADIERRKTKEFSLQLEALKCEVDEAKSKLALVTAKFEETNNKLNAEREKTTMERKHADIEMAKVKEQRKAAEAYQKKAMDEKRHTDYLSQQLEKTCKRVEDLEKEIHELVSKRKLVELPFDQPVRHPSTGSAELTGEICSGTMKREINAEEACKRLAKVEKKMIKEKKRAKLERKKAEEQRQVAEAYKKVAMEEKQHSDQLSHELGCYKQRLKEVQEEIQNLISLKTMVESSTLASGGCLEAETAEMKLLRKQLKFEKMRVKHAKQVAKMERGHNRILGKEVLQLKQDLVQFLQRLDTLGNFVLQRQGSINELEKLGNSSLEQEYFDAEPCQRNLSYGNVPTKPSWTLTATGGFDRLQQNRNCTASLPPISGEIYARSNAGIESKLEPLKRGPNSNMLQTSVINSSSASFSDRPLAVSHERGAFSVNNSPNLTEEIQNRGLIPSGLSSDTKKSYNEKLAVGAENSVGSPIKCGAAARTGNHKKRKRILDAVEPIEYWHSAGQNLHQQVLEKLYLLQRMLNSQMDNSVQEDRLLTANLHGYVCKEVESYKKRKSSAGQAIAIDHLYDSNEPMTSGGTSGVERPDVCKETAANAGDQIGIIRVGKDGMNGPSESNEDLPRNFFEMLDGDPMKLLDLDDDLDEEHFRKAIERPISPITSLIKFQNNEAPEICNNMPLSICTSYEGFSYPKDDPSPSCDFDVINLEIDSNKQTIDRLGSSELLAPHKNRYSNATHESLEINENGNSDIACNCKMSRLEWNSDLGCNVSRNKDSLIVSGNSASTSAGFPRYYIVSSNNNDSSSISRIFRTSNCLSQFCKVSSPEILMQNILLALQKADDLSAKERVCVFVSLLLSYICEVTKWNFGENFDLNSVLVIDSFAQQMRTVLSDVDTRRMFVEFGDMHELLSLMEDFLLNRRVLAYDYVSNESSVGCDSRFKIVSGGSCLFLSIQVVPMKLLVAGGVLLASICAATDQIGFLCELSYNMFRMQKSNSMLVIRLLHIFAHLCGSKYFNLEGYDLQMSVLKSLVVFLEKLNSSTDCTPCFPSVLDASSKNLFCCKCPFSDSVASVDVIVTLLLKKLRELTLGCHLQDPKEAFEWSNPGALSKGDGTEEISGNREAAPSNVVFNENLFYSINILSSLELVAGLMNWDWTFGKIISPLLQMLESCVPENISTAVITLLGQLGRHGIDAKGYQDSGVDSLRNWLSAFVCQSTSRKFGLPIQFASVTALLGLIVRSFQEVVEANIDIPTAVSQSNATNCIRNWFSSLDTEQQSSFWLLNSSIKDNCSSIESFAVNIAV